MSRIVNLNSYLPQVIGDAKEIKALNRAEDIEFNKIFAELDRIHANEFILTADLETLKWYEKVLRIVPKGGVEARRKKVLIEWNRVVLYTDRGLRGILDETIGKDSYFIEYNYNEYVFMFTIKITAEGIDYNELYEFLRETIPTNLIIEFAVLSEPAIEISVEQTDYWYRYFMCGQHKCGTIPRYATTFEKVADNTIDIDLEIDDKQWNLPMTGMVKTGRKSPQFTMKTDTRIRIDAGPYGPTEMVFNVTGENGYQNIDLEKVGDK